MRDSPRREGCIDGVTEITNVSKHQPRFRLDSDAWSVVKLPVRLGSILFVFAACGPSKSKVLAAENSALQIENTRLRLAINQANENIEEAADAIELAQSSLGEKCRDLADAVSEISIPEKVEIP